jgi:hypothetical protein
MFEARQVRVVSIIRGFPIALLKNPFIFVVTPTRTGIGNFYTSSIDPFLPVSIY